MIIYVHAYKYTLLCKKYQQYLCDKPLLIETSEKKNYLYIANIQMFVVFPMQDLFVLFTSAKMQTWHRLSKEHLIS